MICFDESHEMTCRESRICPVAAPIPGDVFVKPRVAREEDTVKSMAVLTLLSAVLVLGLAVGMPPAHGYRPFGRNQDCVCAELEAYTDYLAHSPYQALSQPVPDRFSRLTLQSHCWTPVSARGLSSLIEAIRSFVYTCREGDRGNCNVISRQIGRICPNIANYFDRVPLPPPPRTRKECYDRCKDRCGRAGDRGGGLGNLTADPQCMQECSDKCSREFP